MMSARTMLLAVVATGVALPVQAQAPELEDGRWLPYLGCWVEEGAVAGPMTCVVPESDGVAFLTVVDGEVAERRVVRGDAVPNPVDANGCTGTRTMRFSSDGHRLYTEAALRCGGTERRTRGLMAMVEADRWVEVEALTGDGQTLAWTTRYAPAATDRVARAGLADRVPTRAGRTVRAARLAASSSVDVDDIIEAQARTDTEAVRAWIVEQGDPLRLDADRLIQLADAGVPASVIDVAVAVSFPDRFALEREPRQPRPDDRRGWDSYGRRAWHWNTWSLWSPWTGGYNPYWYAYTRHGYDSWGYYSYGMPYGYGPAVVVVRPVTSSPVGGGRMVKGRGYVPSGSVSSGGARSSVRTQPASSSRSSVGASSSSSSSRGKAKRRGSGGG